MMEPALLLHKIMQTVQQTIQSPIQVHLCKATAQIAWEVPEQLRQQEPPAAPGLQVQEEQLKLQVLQVQRRFPAQMAQIQEEVRALQAAQVLHLQVNPQEALALLIIQDLLVVQDLQDLRVLQELLNKLL